MEYADYNSPLGTILLLSEDGYLTGAYLHGQKHPLPPHATQNKTTPVIQESIQWLNDYFTGNEPDPSQLPLRPTGTPFQQQIWQMLLRIPYGKTITYGQLAKQFPGTMSAQAVGQAVSKNPISIMIPCHRVLGIGNRLTGYAGGIECKVWLLRHEGIDDSKFLYPKNTVGHNSHGIFNYPSF